MAAAADCTLPIALAASGWVVAAGLAIYNTKSLFDYPVSDEPDSPQEGDPSEHLKVYSPCSRSINIASSASGFCGKVETFCRLAGIPYTRHNVDLRTAPKGKMPYIEHSGNRFGDSTLIIKYLERTFFDKYGNRRGPIVRGNACRMEEAQADAPVMEPVAAWTHPLLGKEYVSGGDNSSLPMLVPFALLSEGNRGTSIAMKHCVEGSLDQAMATGRWGPDENWPVVKRELLGNLPALIKAPVSAIVRATVLKQFWAKGFSRHSRGDQLDIVSDDFAAVAALLGAGKAAWEASQLEDKHPRVWFAFGALPSWLDAVVFAFMDAMLNDSAFSTPWPAMIKAHPVIVEYVGLIREQYYAL